MTTFQFTITISFVAAFSSCQCDNRSNHATSTSATKIHIKESIDSSSYKNVKFDFYVNKEGELFERKLADIGVINGNLEFQVYYDKNFSIFTDDTAIEKPLSSVIDINTFVVVDSTEYSKDKNNVYYFHSNSDGGIRVIVDKADPETFKRLCEYRWGIDKNYVFYKDSYLKGLNLKTLKVLYPTDTADHFIEYIKDDKLVYWEYEIVEGADAKTFRVVSNQKWEAEDKNYRYETGRRKE